MHSTLFIASNCDNEFISITSSTHKHISIYVNTYRQTHIHINVYAVYRHSRNDISTASINLKKVITMGMNLYLYKKPIDLLLCVVVTIAKIQEIFQHHVHITTIRTSPIKLTH